MLEKAQTEITHDACLGFFVTFIQRDEEERAGVRCNKVSISRPYPTKVFASSLRIQTSKYKFIPQNSSSDRRTARKILFLRGTLLPPDTSHHIVLHRRNYRVVRSWQDGLL